MAPNPIAAEAATNAPEAAAPPEVTDLTGPDEGTPDAPAAIETSLPPAEPKESNGVLSDEEPAAAACVPVAGEEVTKTTTEEDKKDRWVQKLMRSTCI